MSQSALSVAAAFLGACLKEESTPPELVQCERDPGTATQLDAAHWQVTVVLRREEQVYAQADCRLDLSSFESWSRYTCRIALAADENRFWDYGYESELGHWILRSQITRYRRYRYRVGVTSALRQLYIRDGRAGTEILEDELARLGYPANKAGLEQYLLAAFNRPFRFVQTGEGWELWPAERHPLFSACQVMPKLAEWLSWTELVHGIGPS